MHDIHLANSEPIIEEQSINNSLLLQIANYIESHWEEFDMETWALADESLWERFKFALKGLRLPDSGTVGCIACHTIRLGGGNSSSNTPAEAQRLLRLTDDQALRLFYVYHWPPLYANEYNANYRTTVARAWIAAQRLRHFVDTAGAD